MIRIKNAYVKVVPQVYLALEAVKLGAIEAREAFTDLVLDAEIMVDEAEIQKISKLPDVSADLKQAPQAPPYSAGAGKSLTRDASIQFRSDAERARELARRQMQPPSAAMGAPKDPAGHRIYTGSDWRAKVPEIRKAQYRQKPVIDYIANTYKGDVLKAVAEKLSAIPEQWRQALMANPQYRLETKGLQLSPTEDKAFKSIFVQVVLGLGDYETGDGFLGKLGQEFEQALTSNQVQEAADGLVWKSSLTGLDSLFKSLDPFAGHKESSHQIQGHDVARWKPVEVDPSASEPGYDLHVKEAFLDQIQNALDEKLVNVMGTGIESLQVADDGVFVVQASTPEPATEPERMADDVEEPPPTSPDA